MLKEFLNYFSKLDKTSDEYMLAKIAISSLYDEHEAIEIINSWIYKTSDRKHTQILLSAAIELAHGEGYVFTQHGVQPSIYGAYNEEKRKIIVQKFADFAEILKNKGFDCFLTSGTLLGLIRNKEFIPNDDDFDLAYVSKEKIIPNIIMERMELCRFINSLDNYQASDATGGHFHVYYTVDDGFGFKFDLFTAWIDSNDKFNEYPLKPEIISASQILPLDYTDFYGVSVPVPKNPEAFLELNYGAEWRIPDPLFRFDWDESMEYYSILTKHKIQDEELVFPDAQWMENLLPVVTQENELTEHTDFGLLKVEALTFAMSKSKRPINLAIIGIVRRDLLDFVASNRHEFNNVYFIDDKCPIERDFGHYQSGSVLFEDSFMDYIEECGEWMISDQRHESLGNIPSDSVNLVYFDTNTHEKTSHYLNLIKYKLQPDCMIVFDEYCFKYEFSMANDENAAWWNFVRNGSAKYRFVGKTVWSQVIVSISKGMLN